MPLLAAVALVIGWLRKRSSSLTARLTSLWAPGRSRDNAPLSIYNIRHIPIHLAAMRASRPTGLKSGRQRRMSTSTHTRTIQPGAVLGNDGNLADLGRRLLLLGHGSLPAFDHHCDHLVRHLVVLLAINGSPSALCAAAAQGVAA